MSTYKINLHEAIYSLSDALDLVGVTHIHHGKRVAYMAAECGKRLGWDGARLDDLFQAAILHDCGVSKTTVHEKLVQLAWENDAEHCIVGAELLGSNALLRKFSDVVRYHHTHWSDLAGKDLAEQVKLSANCIYMVDRVDVLSVVAQAKYSDILLGKDEVREQIRERRGSWFAPELVDIFLDISQADAFWFALEGGYVNGYLATWSSHSRAQPVEFAELKALVKVFSYVVDSKSHYTRQHSDGVANLSRYLAEKLPLSEKNREMIELAALLHDIGKLRVPDELLEKPGKLTEPENNRMRRHSFDTYGILKNIKGMETIALWATQHHERIDGSGYPYQLKAADLSLEARIIAVADVFQALAQQRPYRDALSPAEILPVLKEQVENDSLDAQVVALVEANLQECWKVATQAG